MNYINKLQCISTFQEKYTNKLSFKIYAFNKLGTSIIFNGSLIKIKKFNMPFKIFRKNK